MSGKIKVHVKNNRWAEGSFPNTPEGEAVFTITRHRFEEAVKAFPALANRLDVLIDWDEDNFAASMADRRSSSGWRKSTVNQTSPGITLRLLGWLRIMPTVAQALGWNS